MKLFNILILILSVSSHLLKMCRCHLIIHQHEDKKVIPIEHNRKEILLDQIFKSQGLYIV